jgi:hypothetical protein
MSHTDLYFQSRIKRSGYLLYVADGGFVAEKENERITGRTISAVFRKIYYNPTNKKSKK